jgi:hypothetical protein
VVAERFGEDTAENLLEQVFSRVSPGLRDTLQEYDLV